MPLGPHFGRELEHAFGVSHTFTMVWLTPRWVLAVMCTLASIEALYYLGVSRKHTRRQQLPGSVFALLIGIVSSGVMGLHFRRFAYINAMYGTLTSVIILAVWFQITAVAILLGAELNVQVKPRASSGK
jgi:membrane protein